MSGTRVDGRSRILAATALVLGAGAVGAAILMVWGDLARLLAVVVLVPVLLMLAWTAATRRGVVRSAAALAGLAVLVAAAFLVVRGSRHGMWAVATVIMATGSVVASRRALVHAVVDAPAEATVGRARRGTLIVNVRSGGGKAERFGLVAECRRRGIEAIVLGPGDDLAALVRGALERGADVVGMAGGDGSQALVAGVVADAGAGMVCVPAGTRNHFALDLGLDRDDVVGALDAFDEAVERRVDLAEVNGRVFVNNVSLGVYAKVVQSPDYRDAKRQTTAALLPDLLGPGAAPSDLRYVGPDGSVHVGPQVLQVSNNPYVLTLTGGFGSRSRLDSGELGIAAATVRGAADVAAFATAQAAGRPDRFRGWHEWTAQRLVVDADGPVEAGVDGEAMVLEPPLEFRSRPEALRVRIPTHAPARSPAASAAPSVWWSVGALFRAVGGRPTPIAPDRR